MKGKMEKSGRLLIFIVLFLFFISTAQGAWTNDDLMYAKSTTEIRKAVHNINTTEDFEYIQAAIEDPDTKDGHTISVDAGIYTKPVVINKQLKLIGVNKDNTIIDGEGRGNCIQVTADNVEIRGFTIKNGNYGIYLESSNCRVINNYITLVNFDGISLRSNSVNNTIAHNRLSKVKRRGIDLSSSSNNRIHDNDLSGNGKGISLSSSHNNIFYNNSLTDNSNCGISLTFSKNNIIRDNDLSGSDKGIDLSSSDKNYVYHNNFIDNRIQAKDSRDTNRWDNGPIDGGNYWSDHECTGNPSNGSQPYDISGRSATDKYPFMNRDGWTCTLPSPPTLTDPGTTDTDGNYIVSWSTVSNATTYTLEEDTSSSFSSPTKIYSGSGTSREISGKSNDTYYYRVKACNECGCSEWSKSEDITIDTIPPNVNISYPSSEQMFNTTTITVNGTASDNVAVGKVEVRVESGSWQTASGTTSWSELVKLENGANTIYVRATDTSDNTNQTSVTVFVIGESSVTISVVPRTINLLESVNISGNITPLHSANVTLTFTTPNGSIQKNSITSAPNGRYYFVFQPEEVGKWTVNATWAGDPDTAGNTSKTVSFIVIGESRVTISAVPSTINLSESVNISGNITRAHSANVTLTFTTPNNATQKNSITSTPNGSYYFVFQPEEVGKWTVNATWAGDPDTAGNTSKTVSFIVIGESRVTISVVPRTINLSESVNISGNITPPHSAIVTLTFTKPNGSIQKNATNSTSNGTYDFGFTPNEVGTWCVNATWAGDVDYITSETVSFTVIKEPLGYAIIIAGRNNDLMQSCYDCTANSVYKKLLPSGFTNDSIFYLNPSRKQDVDGDDIHVDRISSLRNISYAINTWAWGNVSANDSLLIYMVGHCDNKSDKFIVNGTNDILTASDLNNSLNQLTNATKCDYITVVCEACNSGCFIYNLSCKGRIIVTSTGVNADSMNNETMGGVFSSYFFDNISTGKTIKVAFEAASKSQMIKQNSENLINARRPPQTPLLDDNGDGNGSAIPLNNDTDGALAACRYICTQRNGSGTQGDGHSYNSLIPVIRFEEV